MDQKVLIGVLFAIFAIVCLFIYFQLYGVVTVDSELKIEIPDEWLVCSVDADCIETRPGCCLCGPDGGGGAINARYFSVWEKKLPQLCKDVKCPPLNCKEGNIVCKAGRCTSSSW